MTAATVTTAETRRSLVVPEQIRARVQQLLVFATLILLLVFFSFANEHFMTWANMSNLLLASSVTGIQALGLTFVIATGGIDLTPGLGMALTGVMTATFLTTLSLPVGLGILGGIAVGALIGLVNGTLVAVLKMQPMIATLAMMLVCGGLALVISGARPIYLNSVDGFRDLATGSVLFGVPNAVLIFFAAALVAGLLLGKSILGRYALSIGSNEAATMISGIGVRKWKIIVYTLAGAFTGLSGVVMAARLNSAQPATGQGYEMYAIAAAVIGGTSLRGGRASILGSVVGALIITTINNGMAILSVPDQWQKVALGCVVLLAVYVDIMRRGREE